jgi:hypothetical protein
MKGLLFRVVLPLVLFASEAGAQSAGYAASPFDPSSPGSDWFTTESLDLRGHLRPQVGMLVDWAYAPLLLNDPSGAHIRVLTDQVTVHARSAIVIEERFRFGVGSPLTLYMHGDANQSPSHEQAPGDLRFDADARLFGTYGHAFRGAAGFELFAPMGRRELFTSDGTFRFAPHVLFAGDVKAFAWAAKLGFQYRPFDGRWEGRELGSQLTFALSAGVQINDRFVIGPELHGAAVVTGADAGSARSVPVEALMGGKVRLGNDWQLGSAIGGRFTDGDGGAKMRVLAVLEYAPDICVDKDGDGICAYEDACPEADGPRTDHRKTNGCPIPAAPENPPKPEGLPERD